MVVTDRQVEAWLREDVGHHDVTNDVPGETTGRLVAKESGLAAGLDPAKAVFEYLGVNAAALLTDGDHIESGDIVLEVGGQTRAILRGERVAVNIAGHASGIATRTRDAVEAAQSVTTDVRIACTRKTTPGLRGIEKRAVAAGGGDTHRLDLSHMVMVKDNHVTEMGLEDAVRHFRERASFTTKIEVEVSEPADAPRAARAGADIILLDNMSVTETERAVALLQDLDTTVLTEASGGIDIDNVATYARTGVDIISMGSLTHSAPTLDYSFRTG